MTRVITLTVLLLTTCNLVRADMAPSPRIQELMTAQEYQAAGLDKLSPREREALDQWLARYTSHQAASPAVEPEATREPRESADAEDDGEIRASIKQPFSGWSGKTVFYLDNGQTWRQRQSGRYVYREQDTSVVVSKNFMGFYVLRLNATGKAIGVSRVR